MTPLDQVKARNAFENRAIQSARILSCYSNVADCIPTSIVKAEEAKPLEQKEGEDAAKPLEENK